MVDYVIIIKLGEVIGIFWGYEWIGLDEKGYDIYMDVDGNQMIDGGDCKVIGKVNFDFILGWNNFLFYKNWDLNLFFNGFFGVKCLNFVRYIMVLVEGNFCFVILVDVYLKGFDKIGFLVIYLSLIEGGNNLQLVLIKWLENVDFFCLENISFLYIFFKKIMGFVDLWFIFSCQNFFIIIGYKGMDLVGIIFLNSSVDVDVGIDMGVYFFLRIFIFGFWMNF